MWQHLVLELMKWELFQYARSVGVTQQLSVKRLHVWNGIKLLKQCEQFHLVTKQRFEWLTYILVQWPKNGQWFVYIWISFQKRNLPPPEAPLCFLSLPPTFQCKNSSLSSSSLSLSPVQFSEGLSWWRDSAATIQKCNTENTAKKDLHIFYELHKNISCFSF